MDLCRWCGNDRGSATSCTIATLHICGEPITMIPFGDERWWAVIGAVRCHGCGVAYGGLHHPGCDLQACPLCVDPLMSCRCRFDEVEVCYCPACWGGDDPPRQPMGVDANGCPTELVTIGGTDVIVHYDDIPESDITTVDGIRCTTALRTAIDVAPEMSDDEMNRIIDDCLSRGLFTLGEAWERLAEPDMVGRPGAEVLRRLLPPAA